MAKLNKQVKSDVKELTAVELQAILDNAKKEYQLEIDNSLFAIEEKREFEAFDREWQELSEKKKIVAVEMPSKLGTKDKHFIAFMAGRQVTANLLAEYFRTRNGRGAKNQKSDEITAEFLSGNIDIITCIKEINTVNNGYGHVFNLRKGIISLSSWYKKNQPVLSGYLMQYCG